MRCFSQATIISGRAKSIWSQLQCVCGQFGTYVVVVVVVVVVVGGWWLVVGGWWLVVGGWWLVVVV